MTTPAAPRIDRNIPIDKSKIHYSWNPKYPFRNMIVGDSVFFENEADGSASNPARTARVWGGRQKPARKFSARTIDGGVRIWRIA